MRPLKILRSDGLFRYQEHKKKQIAKTILAIFLSLVVVCAAFFTVYAVSRSLSGDKEEELTGKLKSGASTKMTLQSGDVCTLMLPDGVDVHNVKFTTSDDKIVRVDAAGRVHAMAQGTATVTAIGGDFSASCEFSIDGVKTTYDAPEITTAIIANLDVLAENAKGGSNKLYSIVVNRRTNTVTVYTYDADGKYTVPVRAMVCSCGAKGASTTPVGKFRTASLREWAILYGDDTHEFLYGQYVTEFNGEYLFHSVPYESMTKDSLETKEFNKLGSNASQGCVRLMASDAYWIYANCPLNTPVAVIDKDASADPLGTPPVVRQLIDNGWDPTDPDENNPFKGKLPRILNVDQVALKKGDAFDPMEGVIAKDICGNIITKRVKVTGKVLTDKPGAYYLTYTVTDDFRLSRTVTRTVIVK